MSAFFITIILYIFDFIGKFVSSTRRRVISSPPVKILKFLAGRGKNAIFDAYRSEKISGFFQFQKWVFLICLSRGHFVLTMTINFVIMARPLAKENFVIETSSQSKIPDTVWVNIYVDIYQN